MLINKQPMPELAVNVTTSFAFWGVPEHRHYGGGGGAHVQVIGTDGPSIAEAPLFYMITRRITVVLGCGRGRERAVWDLVTVWGK